MTLLFYLFFKVGIQLFFFYIVLKFLNRMQKKSLHNLSLENM